MSALRGRTFFYVVMKGANKMQRVVMVGSGHLAHALWEGWQLRPKASRNISILARSDAHRHLWSSEEWERVGFDPAMVDGADWVVLAVKPKDLACTIQELLPYLTPQTTLVSTVAGWTLSQIRECGVIGPLVRIMPNVSASIGASTTLVASDSMNASDNQALWEFLGDCGSLTWVEEELMNPYTALIGSGPAYVFVLLQALIDSGIEMGGDGERTRQLVSSMVEGAARLARDRSSESLQEWIRQVASPGGTTEALLDVLSRARWPQMLQDAVVAASRRAQELSLKS